MGGAGGLWRRLRAPLAARPAARLCSAAVRPLASSLHPPACRMSRLLASLLRRPPQVVASASPNVHPARQQPIGPASHSFPQLPTASHMRCPPPFCLPCLLLPLPERAQQSRLHAAAHRTRRLRRQPAALRRQLRSDERSNGGAVRCRCCSLRCCRRCSHRCCRRRRCCCCSCRCLPLHPKWPAGPSAAAHPYVAHPTSPRCPAPACSPAICTCNTRAAGAAGPASRHP